MSQSAAIKSSDVGPPSAEVLSRLASGCWVKVGKGEGLFWAEVTAVEGSKLIGRVQQTFASAGKYGIETGREIKFEKNLVCETGCDKYCFC